MTAIAEEETLVIITGDKETAANAGTFMRLTYDHESDALYVGFRDASAAETFEIADRVVVDVDDEGHIIGLEVLWASKRLSPKELHQLSYENLVTERKAALKLP